MTRMARFDRPTENHLVRAALHGKSTGEEKEEDEKENQEKERR